MQHSYQWHWGERQVTHKLNRFFFKNAHIWNIFDCKNLILILLSKCEFVYAWKFITWFSKHRWGNFSLKPIRQVLFEFIAGPVKFITSIIRTVNLVLNIVHLSITLVQYKLWNWVKGYGVGTQIRPNLYAITRSITRKFCYVLIFSKCQVYLRAKTSRSINKLNYHNILTNIIYKLSMQ